ncbi:MAG: triphosphoribosyl-dephospho-CoA synthase [Methylococcales symbiont of Iophon sp. n. MRB-2018]|nr:MAG: triphosphoribosyl-dephospho-CoA synthase [Methylococcales symbiont of Iophon sp. n. MRB-2018]KAF3979047.1 MAG: triphosphoribosyl-dephospho-CoA synthase [Methylococcales symbiont of Iophon sp. n. MRB-2018]
MIDQTQLVTAYKRACAIDVEAFKPGNVSIYAEGHDMTAEDFILSAEVSAFPITNPDFSLGEKVYYAVKATRERVGCNTNLGILLLSAPICQAIFQQQSAQSLAQALAQVLSNTTQADAEWVFKAITLAAPGGLGDSKQEDVNEAPAVTLIEAMAIASKKDRIAFQYVSNYKDIFDFSILRYNTARVKYDDVVWAAVSVYTGLLTQFPDSHIERKYGNKYSGWVLEQMIIVDDALANTDKPEQCIPLLHDVDRKFKDKGINPGTTADLTVATVFIHFVEALSVR